METIPTYDFSIRQGNTFTLPIAYTDDTGAPIDLSNTTVQMSLRTRPNATTSLLELTSDNGKITLDALNGLMTLTLTATETAALDFSRAVYDLDLVGQGGSVATILQGTVTLELGVTD